MLDQVDLSLWYERLDLPEGARTLIDQIRSSEPARHVGGGHSNVHGRYPSRKMGKIIQFESHRVELAIVLELEHDERVLEYYDQPCTIPLAYSADSGRSLSVMHTPDFFVLRTSTAGWEECKSAAELQKLSEKSPNRYQRTPAGVWGCPPGEGFAESLGLYYRIRSSDEINWIFQRNLLFLDDYVRSSAPACDARQRVLIQSSVRATPGISLQALLCAVTEPAAVDLIYWMIAHKELHVELKVAPLTDPAQVQVFDSRGANLSSSESGCHRGDKSFSQLRPVAVIVGTTVQWDGVTWKVANLGQAYVGLVGGRDAFIEIPIATFERLLKHGTMVPLQREETGVHENKVHVKLAGASERDLKIANERMASIQIQDSSDRGAQATPERTLRFWKARFKRAEQVHGDGYVGLLPEVSRRGNRRDRLSEETRKLMSESIEQDFESRKQKSKYAAWIALKHKCEQKGIAPPSYKTYRLSCGKRSRFEQTSKRKGHRAAYIHEPAFWSLDLTTPRHGDRPFEIGHIDHTELDVELLCSVTGQVLGRPWLTLLVDAFSRRMLALYLTFDPPSYRSCMMVLRNCVKHHQRLPQTLVVDGGREFESTYFETLLARYECIKKTRPPAKARFGSVCERLFGTTNTQFVHNLRGNTQITKDVRQATSSVDPKRLAAWSLGDLHQRLTEYLFEIYDRMDHPALGQSPREAFARGLEAGGLRLQRIVPYDQDFILCSMPTTTKGTAQLRPGKGVKINNIYYWSDRFRDPALEQCRVAVRYDPFDAGRAYAFCQGQWVECLSEHYSILRGRSEREIMLATREMQKRKQQHETKRLNVNARLLATFLESVEAQETLSLQRARDREGGMLELDQPQRVSETEHMVNLPTERELAITTTPVEIYGEF
jgi:putative transposase